MTDFIAEAIAEAAASQPAIVENKPEAPTEPIEQTQDEPQEQTEDNQEKKPEKPQREEWPRSARDKVSRMGKKLTRAEFERDQLRAELEGFKSKPAQPAAETNYGLKEPNQDDYKTYDDFLMARIEYRDQLKEAKQAEQKTESQRTTATQKVEGERINQFLAENAEFEAQTPDAKAVYEASVTTIKKLWDDPATREAILETDGASKGLYQLAKAGELEDLVGLSPYRIAVELSRAANVTAAAPQTKAPPPMTPAKGSATGSKPPSQWSPEEAHKFLTKDR